MDSLINSVFFFSFVQSLEFPIYNTMLSLSRGSCTSFFQLVWFFFSFYCLVTLVMTSSILNKGGESCHLCLVPDLRGKPFNFSLLTMLLAMDLSWVYMAIIMLKYIPSTPSFLIAFIMKRYWIYQLLSLHLLKLLCYFIFHSFNMVYFIK